MLSLHKQVKLKLQNHFEAEAEMEESLFIFLTMFLHILDYVTFLPIFKEMVIIIFHNNKKHRQKILVTEYDYIINIETLIP